MARRVAVPAHVLEMDLLDRVDYGDAFEVEVSPDALARYSADQCAALAMGTAPAWVRGVVRSLQRWTLGLRLTPSDPPVPISGWQRLRTEPTEAVYAASGGLITPRLVVVKAADRILLVTVVRYDRPAARAVWTFVAAPVHRLIARLVLDRGARQVTSLAEAGER